MLILECSELAQMCEDIKPFLNVIKVFLQIVRWSVPILLIILGSWDMFKAVTRANDEKAISEAKNKLIKRIIYGVLVFLVPFFVNLFLELIDDVVAKDENNISPVSWVSCWNESVSTSGCTDIYKKDTKQTSNSSVSNNSTGNSNKCTYLCNNGGKLNSNNECYDHKLDSNSFYGYGAANCPDECGSDAISAKATTSSDGFTYCDCYYPVTKNCN